MSFRVQTGQFTGPFDLLLSLVSRQKVDIGAISVAEVADQFLAEVERMGGMDLEVASDFVLVASTLLDIKAASLVPADGAPAPADDEEDDDFLDLSPDEARDVLVARLMAYKQFRNAGAALGARMEAESRMHPRTAGPDREFLGVMPDFLEGVTLRGLAVICADAESRRQGFLLEAEHVAPRRLPVALAAASVDRVVRAHGCTSFSRLLDGSRDPETVVVTFLAILELFKRGMVRLSQAELFGDIDVAAVEGAGAYEPSAIDLQDMEDDL